MLVERPFVATLIANRKLIWRLAIFQVRDRYAATLLGPLWALIQPAAMLFVYWLIFEYGLRLPRTGPVPFVLMLIVGMIAWLAFMEMVTAGVAAVSDKAYLVKKIAFPLEILPAVPVTAALIVHGGLVILGLVILAANGVLPSHRLLLLVYGVLCLVTLGLGLAYLVAALSVFQADVGQTVGVILQLGFWLTPIVWTPDLLPVEARTVLAWNPMAHVVEIYRAALLPMLPLPTVLEMLRFWVVVVPLAAVGLLTFHRLKHDFADVL